MYANNVAKYQQRYLGDAFIDESFGSLYHIAMIIIPAVLGFFFKKRIIKYINSTSLLDFGLYASLSVLVLNFFSSTVASRLTVYLYFVPMMVYPALINAFSARTRLATTFVIILFHFLILVSWFMLGNHSSAYLPYKNILFDD